MKDTKGHQKESLVASGKSMTGDQLSLVQLIREGHEGRRRIVAGLTPQCLFQGFTFCPELFDFGL